ncbi:MAG: alpha/beta hydrolase [Bdellovibrionota bacterium]
MKFFGLTSLLFFATACSHSSANRTPADAAPEAAAYQSAVDEFDVEREARRPLISHEKHLPATFLQGHPTDYVVVLIHGLFESPFYVKGLTRNFQARGFNVVEPLLSKHWAKPLEKLNEARYQDWLADTLIDVRRAHRLGKKVILAGHSTGGLLAVYFAIQNPELVDGLLLWSPALALTSPIYYGSYTGSHTNGHINLNYNKLAHKPPADPEHVPFYSPLAGREVVRLEQNLLDEFRRSNFTAGVSVIETKQIMYGSINVPVFLMNPEKDTVVYRPEVDLFWKALQTPKVRYDLPGEDHTSTPKDQDDYYPGAQNPNKDFPGMINKLNSFLDENFPPLK